MIIIDEIGYTPIEKREANLFFNMISEMYEKLSIVITSNKSFDAWAEMMGDSIMTTALLDRLLDHARIFNLDGESYRIKNQRKEAWSFPALAQWYFCLPNLLYFHLPQAMQIYLPHL